MSKEPKPTVAPEPDQPQSINEPPGSNVAPVPPPTEPPPQPEQQPTKRELPKHDEERRRR